MVQSTERLYWDPFDVDIDTHPYDIWKRLRDEAPVYRNDALDFWALSRYDDIEAAHRDHATFSSAHGTVLEMMSAEPVPTSMMIFLDPPDHTRLRTLVSRAFTPRRIAALEERIRVIASGLLDGWRPGEPFDFVQGFAARLPSMVISSLFGVPDSDQEHVRHLIDTLFFHDPERGMINDTAFMAGVHLHEYLLDQISQREARPTDDMLTALVEASVVEDDDGHVRRLTNEESARFANLLISAGTETVARLLGWAAVLLARHPNQRAGLAADPSGIPNAVEELLRYEAPSPVQGRWTKRPVSLHGTTIPEASKVLLLTGSAGRDERKYPDAERFDVRRSFDTHVSFGYGIHFCIGAALARMEGRIGLEEVLRRHPAWEVDEEAAVRLHTSTVRGWVNVPVTA